MLPSDADLMGTSFASIWFALTGSFLQIHIPETLLGCLFFVPFMFALLRGSVGVCFVSNVNFKVTFQWEELKSTEPAQELISC